MELWIPITIGAAAAQSLRFMLQKRLTGMALSTAGATFARFIYSMPFVVTLAWGYLSFSQNVLPQFSPRFWVFALGGGLAQMGHLAGRRVAALLGRLGGNLVAAFALIHRARLGQGGNVVNFQGKPSVTRSSRLSAAPGKPLIVKTSPGPGPGR